MYTAIKTGGHDAYKYKHYVADTTDEIENIDLDGCCMGSTVKVIATGNKYILNGSDEWVLDLSSSGGGSGDSSAQIAQLQTQIAELQAQNAELQTQIVELQEATITADMWNALTGEVSNGTLTVQPTMYTLQNDGTLVMGGTE